MIFGVPEIEDTLVRNQKIQQNPIIMMDVYSVELKYQDHSSYKFQNKYHGKKGIKFQVQQFYFNCLTESWFNADFLNARPKGSIFPLSSIPSLDIVFTHLMLIINERWIRTKGG